jgi:hypothetical protein
MEKEKEFYCSDLAWEYGVPLIGTATRGDIWFLIEYPGRWGSKAFVESNIPENVKDYMLGLAYPGVEVRILLIKQTESRKRDGITFFAGQTSALEPLLYEYRLENYSDILDLDLSHLVAGEPGDTTHLRHEPIYLVCANGIRDKCCAVYGPEVYESMKAEAGDDVWQSSHIGGHNQSPIMLFFPHGLNYAHTTPSESRRLVQAYQRGQVVLHHYRGRVCYETHVQAAEHFWRTKTGDLTLPGPQIEVVDILGEDEWIVTISQTDGSNEERIHLKRRFSDYAIPTTCTKSKESKITSFHWIE